MCFLVRWRTIGFLQGVHPAKIDLGKMEEGMGTKPIKNKEKLTQSSALDNYHLQGR